MTSHLDDGTIHELIDGEIPSTSLGPIREHLAACADCRSRLDAAQALADETDSLIESLDEPAASTPAVARAPHRSAASQAWARNAAWAATLVIAVGAGYYVRGNPADAVIERTPGAAQELPRSREPLPAPRDTTTAPPPIAPAAGAGSPRATTVTRDAVTNATSGSATGAVADRPETAREAAPAPVAAEDRAPAPPADPPSAQRAQGLGAAAEARASLGRTANQLAPRDQLTAKQVGAIAADTISFPDAIRRLGGRLLLIEGMVPIRLESDGDAVRVIYRVTGGELVLTQSLQGGRVRHRLVAPAGFPADSVAALERRINE